MQTSAHTSPCLPVKHNTSFSCFLLKTTVDCCGYTLSISLSTTTVWYSIHPLSFFRLGNLRYLHEIHCKSVPTYGHHMLLLLLPFVLFPLQSYVLMPPPLSQPPSPKVKRHLYTGGQTDTCSMQLISIVVVAMALHHRSTWFLKCTCPLPYPSSPASSTLLLPLSVQDSRNISSNGRHHHKLSSLDNNKEGILYLFPNASLMFIQNFHNWKLPLSKT